MNKFQHCSELEGFKKRARSLIVIVSTPPTENYKNFSNKVRKANSEPPFNLKVPPILEKFETFISIYAAYLYDSVGLYARALHNLIDKRQREFYNITSPSLFIKLPPLPEDLVREIANNGSAIIAEIINQKGYKSVTGAEILIDKNGDAEGNFSVLALKDYNFTMKDGFSCNFHMVPIARFQGINSDLLPVKIFINHKFCDIIYKLI